MNFLSVIKNVAPWLVGTFATPAAGLAVKALCDAIPDHAKDVQDAHAADPVNGAATKLGDLLSSGAIKLEQIQAAESAHAVTMAALGYKNVKDLEEISSNDRDSARKREEAVKDHTPAVLAGCAILSAAIVSVLVVSGHAPALKDPAIAATAGTIVGYLFNEVKQVYSYYFGSSSGSRAKDDTISNLSKE